MTKTSIKIKKFWHAPLAEDGGIGTAWVEIAPGQREATVQFNGSDADTTNYKNVQGKTLESSHVKGDETVNFQFADLTPEEMAPFTGGTVTSSAEADTYQAPENPNQVIEKSFKFLTEKGLEFIIARASVDAYPMVNDDDLHYYQVNSTVLEPQKSGVPTSQYSVLKDLSAKDITSFTFGAIDSAPAVIDAVAKTVAITITEASAVGIIPQIGVSLGAGIAPGSGVAQDFSAPVEYIVEAADGTLSTWTVTVTTTP